MKFLHLADLHLGKRLNDFSFLEDQVRLLCQVEEIARSERADAVLIAKFVQGLPLVGAVGGITNFFLVGQVSDYAV